MLPIDWKLWNAIGNSNPAIPETWAGFGPVDPSSPTYALAEPPTRICPTCMCVVPNEMSVLNQHLARCARG